MDWLRVTVDADAARAPVVEDALTAAGALSVSFEDAGAMPLIEPKPGELPLWTETRIVALFAADTDTHAIRAMLARVGDGGDLEPRFERLPDREWSRAWLDDWQPLRFGRRLWVAPLEADLDEPGAVVVRLDPGLAFGTGTHETTALCLDWLDGLDLRGARVLDYGCGSGILAVAAARLGAARACGVDVDPQALEATRANAATNGVAERVETGDTDDPPRGPFDVVVANILAAPLIQAAGTLAGQHAPGGRLALAGVLHEQAGDVIGAYSRWYELGIGAERAGWVRLDGTRRAAP